MKSDIRQFAPDVGARWFEGLMRAVFSLEEMPRRCPLAPEAETLGVELRQLLYGKRAGRLQSVSKMVCSERFSMPHLPDHTRQAVLQIAHESDFLIEDDPLAEAELRDDPVFGHSFVLHLPHATPPTFLSPATE